MLHQILSNAFFSFEHTIILYQSYYMSVFQWSLCAILFYVLDHLARLFGLRMRHDWGIKQFLLASLPILAISVFELLKEETARSSFIDCPFVHNRAQKSPSFSNAWTVVRCPQALKWFWGEQFFPPSSSSWSEFSAHWTFWNFCCFIWLLFVELNASLFSRISKNDVINRQISSARIIKRLLFDMIAF